MRSALAMMSGTVASQAILFVFSPLLSRIFGPGDFGDLANYNAWVAALALLSNLRYEHAMFVVPGRAGMNRVLALTLSLSAIAFVVFSAIAAAVYFAGPTTGYLGEIHRTLPLIPLGTLPTVVVSVLIHFNTRRGGFKTIAAVSLIQVICTLIVQLALGLAGVGEGLVIGALVGSFVAAAGYVILHLRRNSVLHMRREMTRSRLRAMAVDYANFPRYMLAADALTIVVQQFVPVFLTGLFGPVAAGLYAFSTRVVRVPLLVIATSVTAVLRKEAGDQLRRDGSLDTIFRRTIAGLSLIAVGPFAVLMVFATQIFSRVFGDKWVEAGSIVRILGPGLLLEFIALPLFVLFLVTQSQRYTFRIQLTGTILLFVALALGRYYWNSFTMTCVLMSIALVIMNGSTVLAAYAVSRRRHSMPVEALVR